MRFAHRPSVGDDDGDMDDQGAPRSSPTGLFRRGIRVVARYVRQEPRTFVISVIGASLYAAATVGSTVVLGRVCPVLKQE